MVKARMRAEVLAIVSTPIIIMFLRAAGMGIAMSDKPNGLTGPQY